MPGTYQPPLRSVYTQLLTTYLQSVTQDATITVAEQDAIWRLIRQEIVQEQFSIAINVLEERVIRCYGLSRWLGHHESAFSNRDYNEIVHPTHAVVQDLHSLALLELLLLNRIRPVFMQPVCISLVALRQQSGRYLYCKRVCFPFQLTTDKKITEYLCHFTIIKEFNQENYHARLLAPFAPADRLHDSYRSLVKKRFLEQVNFSTQEWRILKRYARQQETTRKMIGSSFKIKESTVNTFNKRILKKAEQFSQKKFSTAKAAAGYFSEMGFV